MSNGMLRKIPSTLSASLAACVLLFSGSAFSKGESYVEKRFTSDETQVEYVIRVHEKYANDKSIFKDAYELVEESESMLINLQKTTGERLAGLPPVRIDWLRKGNTISKGNPEQPEAKADESFNRIDGYSEYAPDDVPTVDSFSAYKPETRNEFNFFIPVEIRELTFRVAVNEKQNDSFVGEIKSETTERVEAVDKRQYYPMGWSFNDDNRVRLGSLNTEINAWPWRTIANFDYGGSNSGCSGTLIGPRHIVTAAHCINTSATDNFFALSARVGRNGSDWKATTTMPGCPNSSTDDCPSIGKTYWYFTPSQWRQSSVSNREQYDFGIIVIPDRLGNNVGWMGYWYAPMGSLNTVSKFSRGYPSCNAGPANNPRIDDPADPAKCPTCTTDLTVCSPFHLYGDAASCSVGNGTNLDGDGYNRNFRMSCDGSAGMSGSPLYLYGNGNVGNDGSVYYTAHDIQSTCGGTASSYSCENVSRADRMVRLTPQYASWISYFRSTFP